MIGKEIWENIKGYEGIYQVSNFGNIKSLKRVVKFGTGERVIKETQMKFTVRSGYYNVILRKNNVRSSRQVHRLVAEAFVPNPNNLPIVNHLDYNRKNNNAENLEWCTQKENVKWSIQNMCKPKSVTKSATGEKYVYKRGKKFRVSYHKFDKIFSNLNDAILFRNKLMSNE